MSKQGRRGARSRRMRPMIEGLEGRDLPSSLGPALPGRHYPALHVQRFVPILYPPGTPQPTADEVKRESFTARAVGDYTLGPGRFSTQSLTIRGYGKSATSNFSSVTRFQFLIFEPSTPGGQVTGALHLLSASFLASGSYLILDFSGPTGTEVHGLPTHLYWVHDGSSGTMFTGAGSGIPAFGNFPGNYLNSNGTLTSPLAIGAAPTSVDNWNMGLGDARFQFIPSAHPRPGTLGSGKVIMVLSGLLNASGTLNPADKAIN